MAHALIGFSKTEEEAKILICSYLSSSTKKTNCKGCECMQWKFLFPDRIYESHLRNTAASHAVELGGSLEAHPTEHRTFIIKGKGLCMRDFSNNPKL
jgi:hypothetical protein